MRTLATMILQVRKYIDDVHDQEKENDEIIDALRDAWEQVCHDLVGSNVGRRCLLKNGDPVDFVADQEEYALPDDILLIDGVQVKFSSSDRRWKKLEKRDPDCNGFRSGNLSILGDEQVVTFGCLFWSDDEESAGDIRIWPAFTSVSDQQFRFRYYHLPAFPSDDAGTFWDPDNTGENKRLPLRLDRAVEYKAAALLSMEEVEDQKTGRLNTSQYNKIISDIIGTTGGGVLRSNTRYVRV